MWSNDECITLISSVECQVLRIHPITSANNNHDFTGNLLDLIRNWSEIAEKLKRTVADCQNQWRNLIRQFLFITERSNTDENDSRSNNVVVYPIKWLLMERMMFLLPYISKYKRYEKPIEISNEKSDNEETTTETTVQRTGDTRSASNQSTPIKDLKRMTIEMLKGRSTPAQIRELMCNFSQHYRRNRNVLCKIIYMIELNTADWTDFDRKTFLRWYCQTLQKIANNFESR